MNRRFVPIDALRGEVGLARRWLSSIGIECSGTRLKSVEDKLRHLSERQLNSVELRRELLNDGALYSAVLDARSFSGITASFSRLKPDHLPKQKLREMLGGPPDLADEEAGQADVNSRNTLAELELASDFVAVGFRPLGYDDLCIAFEGAEFWIETKRLLSPRRVHDNTEKAYEQLKRRMEHPADRGIVALNASGALGLQPGLATVRGDRGLDELTQHLEREFIQAFGVPGGQFVDTRVLGTLIIFKLLVCLEREDLPVLVGPAKLSVLYTPVSSASLEAKERLRLNRLFSLLNSDVEPGS